jgi:hypothetical protein
MYYGGFYGNLGYGSDRVTQETMRKHAVKMIKEAGSGLQLEHYNKIKGGKHYRHPSSMWGGVANDEEWFLHVAYWTAVGSAIANAHDHLKAKAKPLRNMAGKYLALEEKYNSARYPDWANEANGGGWYHVKRMKPSVYTAWKSGLGANGADALIAAMEGQTDYEARAIRKQYLHETSVAGKYIDPIKMTGSDIVDAGERGIDFWDKYGKYLLYAGGALALLYVAGPLLKLTGKATAAGHRRAKAKRAPTEESYDSYASEEGYE